MIAFADTLFKADFAFDTNSDGVIWVQKVKDPSSFGVVRLDNEGYISELVEKPAVFVSNLAIVGIYYFREGEKLRAALHHIITNEIKEKNEYQLATALEHLKNNGLRFRTGEIEEWLDCGEQGSDPVFQRAYARVSPRFGISVAESHHRKQRHHSAVFYRRQCRGATPLLGLTSAWDTTRQWKMLITNSIIQNKWPIKNAVLENSMVGNVSKFIGSKDELNLGDFSHFSKR